jgi:hypothetical protein
MEQELGFAVVELGDRLRGVDTAVQFEVELSMPGY